MTDRWMSAMGKEEKVRVQLKSFGEQMQNVTEVLYRTKSTTETGMAEMKGLLSTEVKDLKSANHAYSIELERNQKLFREL